MRIASKTDRNHQEIINALRKCGFSVFSLHRVGKGFPDLIVGKNGVNVLLEIKDGAKPKSAQKLTSDEIAFHSEWRGQVAVVGSAEEAIATASRITGSQSC